MCTHMRVHTLFFFGYTKRLCETCSEMLTASHISRQYYFLFFYRALVEPGRLGGIVGASIVEDMHSQSVHPFSEAQATCCAQPNQVGHVGSMDNYLILDIFIIAQFCRRRGGSLIGWRLRTQGEAGQPAGGVCLPLPSLARRTVYNDGDGVESALVRTPLL